MVLRSGVQPQVRKLILKVKNKLLELLRTTIWKHWRQKCNVRLWKFWLSPQYFIQDLKNGKQNLDNLKHVHHLSQIQHQKPTNFLISNSQSKNVWNSPFDRGLNIYNKILNHFKQLQSVKLCQETYKNLNWKSIISSWRIVKWFLVGRTKFSFYFLNNRKKYYIIHCTKYLQNIFSSLHCMKKTPIC